MTDLIRASDITTTMAKVKVITERLNTLTTDLANWKIYVAVDVRQGVADGLEINISIAKNNKQGFIYNVSPAAVARYVDDPETLISEITELVFERLFKEQIRNELTAPVVRALQNAVGKNNV